MSICKELKTEKRKELDKYFGQEIHMTSKNMFSFKNIINNDTIIILTRDITKINNKNIFIVGKNSGIYLQDWQIKKLCNHQKGINCYAIKLYRKYYKPYQFSFNFANIKFDKRSFDDFINIARNQQKEKISFKEGWGDF